MKQLYIYNNVLAIEYSYLVDNGFISKSALNSQIARNTIVRLRRPARNNPTLIEFETLPESIQDKIKSIVGNPYDLVNNEYAFQNFIERDQKAISFFRGYQTKDGNFLPTKKQIQYVWQASIFNTYIDITTSNTMMRRRMGDSKQDLTGKIITAIHELPKQKFDFGTLPKQKKPFQRKLNKYKKNGYESLIHGNYANTNSNKIKENAKLWLLSKWAGKTPVIPTIKQLHDLYNTHAESLGFDHIASEKTIYNFLNHGSVKHLWFAARYGEQKSKEKFMYQHSTKLPSMRDSLWYGDGTKLNYYYKDENGKTSTCQVYEVIDAFSEVFLGYHISKSENYEAQFYAYKMAIQTSGHKPYQIGHDGQGGHGKLKAGHFLKNITKLTVKTTPYNGKSKTIENAFGRFQQQFLKRDWFFTGQNIQAKKIESKANMEFITANSDNLPTLDEIKEIYKQRRNEWNNAKHPKYDQSRIALYYGSVNEATPKVDIMDMVEMFWILRTKTVKFIAYGLTFEENKIKYTYTKYTDDQLPDFEWIRQNVDKDFHIRFDPENMHEVYIYDKDSNDELRFVTRLGRKITTSRAIQEQEKYETEYLAKVQKLSKESRITSKNEMDAILERFGDRPEDNVLRTPHILGVEKSGKKRGRPKQDKSLGQHQKELSNKTELENSKKPKNWYDLL